MSVNFAHFKVLLEILVPVNTAFLRGCSQTRWWCTCFFCIRKLFGSLKNSWLSVLKSHWQEFLRINYGLNSLMIHFSIEQTDVRFTIITYEYMDNTRRLYKLGKKDDSFV